MLTNTHTHTHIVHIDTHRAKERCNVLFMWIDQPKSLTNFCNARMRNEEKRMQESAHTNDRAFNLPVYSVISVYWHTFSFCLSDSASYNFSYYFIWSCLIHSMSDCVCVHTALPFLTSMYEKTTCFYYVFVANFISIRFYVVKQQQQPLQTQRK